MMNKTSAIIRYSAATRKGADRKTSEDRIMIDGCILKTGTVVGEATDRIVAVVCDGVGGENGGAVASQIAATSFIDYQYHDNGYQDISGVLRYVNGRILKSQRLLNGFEHMATTVAGVVVSKGLVFSFNLGDTRIYRCSERSVTCISKDHVSRAGIVKYLGGRGYAALPAVHISEVSHNSMLLICSDGYYKQVDEESIGRVLKHPHAGINKANHLLDHVNNSMPDDASVIVLEIDSVQDTKRARVSHQKPSIVFR